MSNKITAKSLRQICDMVEININPILERCLAAAEAGEDYIIYNDKLSTKQKLELMERELTILSSDEAAMESYIIKW